MYYLKLLALYCCLWAVNCTTADDVCGLSADEGSSRIIEGSPAEPNEFPWMVYLMINTTLEGQSSMVSCGASIIAGKYLLSAAHCFTGNVKWIHALIGYHVLNINERPDMQTGYELKLPVKRLILHEGFDSRYLRNDIAVIELEAPLEFNDKVHAICLPPPQDPQGSIPQDSGNAVVAGWGFTQVYGSYFTPQMLLTATVPLMSMKLCKKRPMIGPRVSRTNICAGGYGSDTCNGDSGGPLMTYTNQGRGVRKFTQIGIVSAGIGCGAFRGVPAVYTRVASYVKWIQQITG